MGTNKVQAWNVGLSGASPTFYEVKLNTDGLNVLELNGLAWLLFVLYNRNPEMIPDMSVLKCSCEAVKDMYDLVYGDIADDALYTAIQNCFDGFITVETCFEALRMYGLGKQYAAISLKACSALEVTRVEHVDRRVFEQFMPPLSKRSKAYNDFRKLRRSTPGHFLDNIMQEVSHCVVTEDRLNSMRMLGADAP